MSKESKYLCLKDIIAKGYCVENNIVSFDVEVIGHFGNVVSLIIAAESVIPYSAYNNTANVGYILKYLVELLGIEEEDGLQLSQIKNIPVRLIFDCKDSTSILGAKCIGIGHFMQDRFVMFNTLAKMDK